MLIGEREATFTEGRTKKTMKLPFWVGVFRNTHERCTWQYDGHFSPVQDHDLDLVKKGWR